MIEVQGLVKSYGAKRAVDGVTFSVRRGDILGFLGPNGAGKSTTMKMLTGYLRPDADIATVDGIDVTTNPVAVKQKLGYLPESAPAYPEMTVEEFLGFIAEIRGFRAASDRRAQVDRAIGLTHLDPVRRQTIETLSKGFKQRVGFAQALLHNPPALVLDARAGWRLTETAELYVAADNLFDAAVETAETADGTESFGEPRTFRVGVRIRRGGS